MKRLLPPALFLGRPRGFLALDRGKGRDRTSSAIFQQTLKWANTGIIGVDHVHDDLLAVMMVVTKSLRERSSIDTVSRFAKTALFSARLITGGETSVPMCGDENILSKTWEAIEKMAS